MNVLINGYKEKTFVWKKENTFLLRLRGIRMQGDGSVVLTFLPFLKYEIKPGSVTLYLRCLGTQFIVIALHRKRPFITILPVDMKDHIL